jgi:AcrR family transcriptional regulator
VPRIVKHPELRRNELLGCAQALFLERGYDKASLNEVIIAAGVSKGAFYHYFASKEALLEALAARFAEAALARIRTVLDAPDLVKTRSRTSRRPGRSSNHCSGPKISSSFTVSAWRLVPSCRQS